MKTLITGQICNVPAWLWFFSRVGHSFCLRYFGAVQSKMLFSLNKVKVGMALQIFVGSKHIVLVHHIPCGCHSLPWTVCRLINKYPHRFDYFLYEGNLCISQVGWKSPKSVPSFWHHQKGRCSDFHPFLRSDGRAIKRESFCGTQLESSFSGEKCIDFHKDWQTASKDSGLDLNVPEWISEGILNCSRSCALQVEILLPTETLLGIQVY